MHRKLLIVIAFLAACSTGPADPTEATASSDQGSLSPDGVIHRDVAALERVKYTPQACDTDQSCPVGSHCDDRTETCDWACLADTDCGPNKACDALGRCVNHPSLYVSNTTSGCQLLSVQERRDGLLGVNGSTPLNQQHLGCFLGTDDTSDTCPCGSYCTLDTECHVDCLADNPPPGYEAGAGMECTPSGRRVPTGAPPNGPPLQVSLEISPSAISANTAIAAVLVPVTVNVNVNSLEFLQAKHPAKVRYHVEATTGPTPLVKCAVNRTPTAFCDLDGNWNFNLAAHNLHSASRTIWVQIPKSITARSWTLVARSESAVASATAAVLARPVVIPATDPGHYTGKLSWPNPGAAPGTPDLVLPVEAIVTATHVALFDPTQVILPDGHAVLPRDVTKSTMLGWLSSSATGAARYDVRLDLGAVTYSATTGHLDGGITLTTGTGAGATPLTLALDRTGDATAPTCPATGSCAAGTYCETTMNLCLPGAGAAAGAGIVDRTGAAAIPSKVLASSQLQAWSPAVTTLATNNPALLGGTGLLGIGHAYCYQPNETIAGKFAMTGTMRAPSFDLGCSHGPLQPVVEHDQTAFVLANQTTEMQLDSHGAQIFSLLEACLGDLAAPPTGPFTPANLLGAKPCASLARFYLALNANAGQTFDVAQMRMVTQVLRQWLGVQAYVANTSVQDKQYDDALGDSAASAETRLGNAIDLVDQGLRVVLDPAVRPQFADGSLSPIVAVTPDYRIAQRPVARWSYNGSASGWWFPATDGPTWFSVPPSLALWSGIFSNDPNITGTVAVCKSNDAIGIDNSRFSIVFYLQNAINGGSFILFDKTALDGQRIWIEATPGAASQLSLVVKDSAGGSAAFPPISSANAPWGMLGFTANNGSYQLVQVQPGLTTVLGASSVVNGGPHWGSAGPVQLGCNLPTTCQNGSCTSWDRNTVGDGLDVTYSNSNETAWTLVRTCETRPGAHPPTSCSGATGTQDQCNTSAATRRVQLLSTRFPNAPSSLRTMFVTGTMSQQTTTEDGDSSIVTTTTYSCRLAVTDLATPINAVKPVCGCAGNSTTWVPQRLYYDELLLWSRPLEPEEITTMAASYNFLGTNESLPPASQAPLPGVEQETGLAVHLVEAAGADLQLLAGYLDAERAVSYGECYQGAPSPARDRARGRAGRNLRLVAVLEAEAAHLASAAGATTAPWFARYQASQSVLAAKRARVVQGLQQLAECKNPLGIPEEELPLFVGQTVTAAERFFASTRFLTEQADREITAAAAALSAAQLAYNAQVTADFTRQLTATDQANAIEKLKVSYDGVLRRYCGAPAGGSQRLVDGFMAGTVNADNCFFKTELAQCQNLALTPIANLPPECLRGEIGEHFMAIKSALLDVTAARASATRATELFNSDTLYCALRQVGLESNQVLLQRHQEHMVSLRQELDDDNDIAFGIGAIASFYSQNYGGGVADIQNASNIDTNFHIQQEQDRYQLEVSARSLALDVKECFHKADNDEFAIRAANDTVLRADEAVRAAAFGLTDARATIAALASEAKGQVSLESAVDRTPPHLHYWLDNAIDTYNRHLVLARRLTYLAVRAYEYEAQQSSGRRGTVLTARRPDELAAVTAFLEGKSAPVSGGPFVFGDHAFVLSLRDELLHIEDLSANLHRAPGDPPLTAAAILQAFLKSDASKIYGANHQLLGHGIRFSLRPDFWNGNVCAERMSRIVPLVSHSLPSIPAHPEVLLIQDNAFGSQLCGEAPGSLTITRVGAPTNLVTDDASTAFAPLATSTSMLLSLAPSTVTSRETLADLPFGPPSAFAGRGLYGTYTLVFPTDPTACTPAGCSGWSDDAVAKINDVLFRFEIVDGTQQAGQGLAHATQGVTP